MDKEFYQTSASDCLKIFNSNIDGLSASEVEKRLPESRKYLISDAKKQSFFSKFLSQIKELMILVLLVSGIVSIIIGIIENSSGEIVDGSIILGIVIMNALFGVFQERKSEKAIENLKKMTQPETLVIRDGVALKIKTKDLVLGDIASLKAGSIVPADLRLVKTSDVKINEASLTGESEPVEKISDVTYNKKLQLADRKNMAYSGSIVENGHALGIVIALGKETEIGKIAESLKETKKELTPLQKSIQNVGKILTYLILLVAGVTFILEVIANPTQILQAFLTAVAISVAAIPESMPAVITIIMSLGIAKLSKQKAIVKRMHAVETLGACDCICSDKTGTITQNKMKVVDFFTFFPQKSENFAFFLKNMVLCNDAQLGKSGYEGGSTEVALLDYAHTFGVEKKVEDEKSKRINEISFNSKRKMMSTLNLVDGKKIVFVKGALDRVLQKCKTYLSDDKIIPLDDFSKQKIENENKRMCKQAERVICFAYKETDSTIIEECDLTFLGLCGIFDPPRPEIEEAVKKCRKAGMRPVMITGDYKDTALAIAKKVGIAKNEDEVLSGEEIDLLDDENFEKIVEKISVFARVSPSHKVRIVEALKKNGHIVAMTGDGVNDAPSLKKADIGIGMGKTGTDVTKETADMIITDDNFATIVVATQEGRKIYSNIQKTVKYLFSANMAEILALFFITILFPGLTFLLPVQILFVNLITDSLPAIALGTEPVENSIMNEKPRRKTDGLFSNGVGVEIVVLGAIQTILTMGAYLFGLFTQGETIAVTMAFYTLNLIQLFYMFTARTKEYCFKSNPFKNKFLCLSMIVGFGLLILMATTNFGKILKLETLNFSCWIVVILLSISIIFIGELFKLIKNSHFSRKKAKK